MKIELDQNFCDVVKSVYKKRYEGHNRANASIIEACILASRIGMIPEKKILNELDYLSIGVEKTSGKKKKKRGKRLILIFLKIE